MIDPLNTFLSKLYMSIPMELLTATFKPTVRKKSLDQCIIDDVIISYVRSQINIAGGKIIKIPLTMENATLLAPPALATLGLTSTWSVYRIHPIIRENKPLSAVLSIVIPYQYVGGTYPSSPAGNGGMGVTLPDIACQALNAQTFAQATTTPTPILLAGDLIRLDPPMMTHLDWLLIARVNYDENFTNMDVNIIPTFVELCIWAVKQYIYVQNVFAIDRTYLSGGQELGVYKQIAESYADAETQFMELLKVFNRAIIMEPERLKMWLPYIV